MGMRGKCVACVCMCRGYGTLPISLLASFSTLLWVRSIVLFMLAFKKITLKIRSEK